MWVFTAFVGYLGCAYLIAAVLEYPLYRLFNRFAPVAYHEISGHLLIPIALLGLYPFFKRLQLDNKEALGYALPRWRFTGDLGQGFLLGLLVIVPLVLALFALEIRVLKADHWVWATLGVKFGKALLSGLVVGFIEETFFRGALYGAIRGSSGFWPAATLASGLYAAVHFIDSDMSIPRESLHWWSGLVILGDAFRAFAHPADFVDSLLALFAVGIMLTAVRAKSGHIASCIGMHASWVVTIKLVKSISNVNETSALRWLVGTYDGIIGYLAFAWIGALTILYLTYYSPRQSAQDGRSSPG